MLITREWGMPSGNTFSIPPIRKFIDRWLSGCVDTVDPFARDTALAKHTNDLNPATAAQHHMPADEFLEMLHGSDVTVDAALFDPPYSPRQISELYRCIGKTPTAEDTQNARLFRVCRDALDKLVKPQGVVLSFGWSSNGMGKKRGYQIEEIMLVAHGGAHNDTICIAERKIGHSQGNMFS